MKLKLQEAVPAIINSNALCMQERECCSAESTGVEDSSDEGTAVSESTSAEDTSDESNVVGATTTAADPLAPSAVSVPDSNMLDALVAGLREARLLACARRACCGNTSDNLRSSELSDTPAPSQTQDLVAATRAARLNAAAQRVALTAAHIAAMRNRSFVEFVVTICTVAGTCFEIAHLHPGMQICELCEIVAEKIEIPSFAVRLMIEGQVLHMSYHGLSLGMAGIAEGSRLTLVKAFGWAKPDIPKLSELERQWCGEPQFRS